MRIIFFKSWLKTDLAVLACILRLSVIFADQTDLALIQNGVISNVGEEWVDVRFEYPIEEPVVVCTPVGKKEHTSVAIVREITATGFQVKMVKGHDASADLNFQITYIALPNLMPGGNTLSSYQADVVDGNGFSNKKNWNNSIAISYGKSFSNPVVLGQVIVSGNVNQPGYLNFYSHGQNRSLPANSSQLFIGVHSGEYFGKIEHEFKMAYVVFEAGIYQLPSSILEVNLTDKVVKGADSPYQLKTGRDQLDNISVSRAGIRGGDGGFPLVFGDNIQQAFGDTKIKLAIGEDRFYDNETFHTTEQLSVAVFTRQLAAPVISPGPIALFSGNGGFLEITTSLNSQAWFTKDGSLPVEYQSEAYSEAVEFNFSGLLKALAEKEGYVKSIVSQRNVFVLSESIEGLHNGLIISKVHWPSEKGSTYDRVPDLTGSLFSSVGLSQGVSQALNKYQILRLDGYIYIPEDDTYTIFLDKHGHNAIDVYIDDMDTPLITRSRHQGGASSQKFFQRGLHQFRAIALQNYWRGTMGLQWSSSSISKTTVPDHYFFYREHEKSGMETLIDQDNDGLTNLQEIELGTDIRNQDTDFDGLTDMEEVEKYGTDALVRDSDGDGYDDFLEAIVFKSLESDDLGDVNEVLKIEAKDYTFSKGEWRTQGNAVISSTFRGELEYDLTISETDMYLFDVFGGAGSIEYYNKNYTISLWLDGEYLGERTLVNRSDAKDDNFAMEFSGSLGIESASDYTFSLNSDDGSQLYIDNQLVVDNDGLHGVKIVSGNIELMPGNHSIVVKYFDRLGGQNLSVSFFSPEFSEREITALDLNGPLSWKYYEGAWSKIPDFGFMTPVKSGFSDRFDINVRKVVPPISTTFILPYIKPGEHKLKLVWENGIYDKQLMIEKLVLKSVTGTDENLNGIKDWIDTKVGQESTVSEPATFKVSPICVEGTSPHLNLLSVSAASNVYKSREMGWYTDIHLNPEQETEVTISFQNGVKTVSKSYMWEETHVPSESSMTIRLGDSLLLNPNPFGLSGAGEIYVGGNQYTLATNQNIPIEFNQAGEFEVTSLYTNESGDVVSSTIPVNVIEVHLPKEPLIGLVGSERRLDLNQYLSGDSIFDADSRLNAWYKTSNGDIAIGFDSISERHVVARLYENGPILDGMSLQGIKVYGAGQTSFKIIDEFEDGSLLMRLVVTVTPLPENLKVHHDVFLSGVIFSDGSSDKIYTTQDFDEIQQHEAYLIKTPSARKTAACNHIDVYQNGIYVGRAY